MAFQSLRDDNVSRPQRLEHLTVLVVDDDRRMRLLIKTMLHQMGIREVRLAAGAAEACRELTVLRCDLIISDLRILPQDGIELARLARNAKGIRNPSAPIVMLTGPADSRAVRQAMAAGANDFLAKPISISRLRARIERLLFPKPREIKTPLGAEAGAEPDAPAQARIESVQRN